MRRTLPLLLAFGLGATALAAQAKPAAKPAKPDPRIEAFKQAVAAEVEARAKLTQEINDQIFSFGELGFQEFETSKYLIALLRKEGFTVEEGFGGIPTAWVATWGSGKPVIA
ncbi:MAG: hypothetical protein SFV24_22295, partial [Gemmatimonadales bacterium]|nr:hypothetical protein [Gemmatimonadales bacterium]